MVRNPTDPPPPVGRKGEATPDRGERGDVKASAERYGPITLARHAKDDGRALILYRRSDTTRS